MKQELVNLLLQMLKSYGYQTTDGVFCDILCRRDGYELYVMCDTEGDISLLDRFTRDVEGCRGLYVTMRKIRGGDDSVKETYARETGVMIWDRSELIRNVGKYFVDNVDKEALSAMIGEFVVDSIDDEKKNFDLTFFLTSGTPSGNGRPRADPLSAPGSVSRPAAAPAAPASAAPAPAAPDVFQKPSGFEKEPVRSAPDDGQKLIIATPSSKINTPPEKAMAIAKSVLGGAEKAVLKFVPYWKYSYYVSVDRVFGGERVVISESGEGLVNAINGADDTIELGEITTQTAIPDIEYEQKTAKVSKEDIRDGIIQKLIREHARDIRSSTTDAQVLISQNRVFRPSPSDIDIHIQQVYAAVWEVKGRKKSVEINAYNGKLLENPADDGVEFV